MQIKNKLLTVSASVLALSFNANAAEVDKNTAKIQAMDKITGNVSVLEIPVNAESKFEDFSIVVRACKSRPPEETPENFAFVDIAEKSDGQLKNIYKGWMVSSSPALNPVEHPMYDIWLLECVDGPVDKTKLLTPEDLSLRDGIDSLQNQELPPVPDVQLQQEDAVLAPESILNIQETAQTQETESVAETAPVVEQPVAAAPSAELEGLNASPEDAVSVEPVIEPTQPIQTEGAESIVGVDASQVPVVIEPEVVNQAIEETAVEVDAGEGVESEAENIAPIEAETNVEPMVEAETDVIPEASQLIDLSDIVSENGFVVEGDSPVVSEEAVQSESEIVVEPAQ